MIPSSKEQKQYIYKLCRFNKEIKEAAVLGISNGRTESTTMLSHAEANQLIASIGGKPVNYDNWAWFDKKNKKHAYILSLAIQLGWSCKSNSGRVIADLGRLSEWLKSAKSPVKKPIKGMTTIELSKVITALEQMEIKKYK